MSEWNCAIIRNTSDQPIALVVLVTASAFNRASEGDAVRANLRTRHHPPRDFRIVLANQSGATLNLNGDANLVRQLSRQNWSGWDWRDVSVS